MKKIILKVSCSILFILLTGCQETGVVELKEKTEDTFKPSPCYGDSLVMSSNADIQTQNPLQSLDTTTNMVLGKIYSGVTGIDDQDRVIGDLADTWETSSDGTSFIFHLRRNVFWHDNVPFTAADVKFTFDLIRKSDTVTHLRDMMSSLNTVEILDDYSFRADFVKKSAYSLNTFFIPVIARHIFENLDVNDPESHRMPVGTGAFRFRSRTAGEKIILESNDKYYEEPPFIRNLVIKIIPDSSMLFLSLKRGDIDTISLTADQYLKQADEDFNRHFQIFRTSQPRNYVYISFNLNHPFLKNIEVRRALSLSVDRDLIISDVLKGFGKKTSGPFSADAWPYNSSVSMLPYDPAQAGRILKEQGFSDSDGDGILEKEGKKLSLRLYTVNGNQSYCLAAEIAADGFRRAGCEVLLEKREFTSLVKTVQELDYDTLLISYTYWSGFNLRDLWHSSAVPDKDRGISGLNMMAYKNIEVDSLIEELEVESDLEKRISLFHRFHEIISRDIPQIFLYSAEGIAAVDKRFQGIEVARTGIYGSLNHWYVPGELQKYKEQ